MDVSFLIATRDRASSLKRTLHAIAAQKLDGLSWEVVVIDNGSTDGTRQVLLDAAKSLLLVTLSESSPGKNRALNRGIDVARGKLLIFTDDDVIPSPDWGAELVSASQRWPEDNIFGGTIKPRFPASTPAWLTGDDFPYGRWAFGEYAPRFDEGPTGDTPLGASVALRRGVFSGRRFDEEMGPQGRDYPMGSEVEFLLRLYRQGEQFIFVPSAVVEHVLEEHDVERDYLLGRAYRCGRGNARLFPGSGNFPLFGIPLYQVSRAIAAVGGAAASFFRHEGDRWIASLTLHQVKGNIGERRRLFRSGVTGARMPRARALRRLRLRRGLLGAVLTPVRWAILPFVRYDVYQFFEYDLEQRMPESPDAHGVSVDVVRGSENSRAVRVALCPMELLKPEEIDRRLERGDSAAIAWADGRVIGYAWSAYSGLVVPEIGSVVRLEPSDVVGYDGYVAPNHRGRGILPLLDTAQINAAVESGRTRQLIYTNTRNKAASRTLSRMGKRKLFKVAYVRIPLLDWESKLGRGSSLPAWLHDARHTPQD